MSSKNKLIHEMLRLAILSGGGSTQTRQAYWYFIQLFVRVIYFMGFPLTSIEQIGVRAIEAFVEERRRTRKSVRTIQNDLGRLRKILARAGRTQFVREPKISNAGLGISGGSRRGTKVPTTDAEFATLLARVEDPGLHIVLRLQRWLGLRAQEAISSIESLRTWQSALLSGSTEIRVTVIYGTKGGRVRSVRIFDPRETLAAVTDAIDLLATGRKLAPKATLRQAMKWYSNSMQKLSFSGHALRYRYAKDSVVACIAAGFSPKEALAMTAMSLGHGDGRVRMVKSVYCRTLFHSKTPDDGASGATK